MECKYCGNLNLPNAAFCTKCGRKIEKDIPSSSQAGRTGEDSSWQKQYSPNPTSNPQPPAFPQQPNFPPQQSYQQQDQYQGYAQEPYIPADNFAGNQAFTTAPMAGLGNRFLAFLLDSLILGVAIGIPAFVIIFLAAGSAAYTGVSSRSIAGGSQVLQWFIDIIASIVAVLYFAFFESSKYQATLGKMALKIKVVNSYGQRLSFVNALGRGAFKYFISGYCCCIGYIWAFFNDERKALHDIVASTSVIDASVTNYSQPYNEPPQFYNQQPPQPPM